MHPGRNDPCPCGSGKKYKKCCGKPGTSQYLPSGQPETNATVLNGFTTGTSPTADEFRQLVALYSAGHYADLERRTHLLLKRYPDSGVVWKISGVTLQAQGKDSLSALRKATKLLPDDAEAHYNLGNTLRKLGRMDEAEASYRQALQIRPDYAAALSNMGNLILEQGRLDEAEASYRRALEIRPDFAEVHYNLGNILRGLGHPDEAEASYRLALQNKPDYAEGHGNLGNLLFDMGRLGEAEVSYRRALQIRPDYAEAYSNLGRVLHDTGRLDEAEASCRRALEIQPDFADAYNNLGIILKDQGEPAEAEASLRRALEIQPDFAEVHSNLGIIFAEQGKPAEAEASYRRALEIQPDYAEAYSNLLFLCGYYALIAPHEYLAQARSWEQACVPALDRQAAHDRIFSRPPLTARRLKVGYVSGDYRQHAVSYFMEQLFTHHDRARIELFAYSTQGQQDAVTDRLQALAEHWVLLAGIPDAAILDHIEADGIDVLIDLSGHTKHNRLDIFVRRAAPVQVHYLGYFASTGLTEMDYWIGDEILTPAETDSHFSEQVWRLPRVWVSYNDKTDAPPPDWHPAQDGSVWLGSFNNLGKLTPATLALWAKVLHALPEGRLLLKTKALSDANNCQRILEAMAGHGIVPDRIEFQGSNATPDWPAHMAYYDRLDIALDPIGGVGGGTTTCDALWMGVPVIALEGDRMASRMTAAMLDAIGHPEWITSSETEYIDKVVALARDVEQRNVLRFGQRDRMARSPLCDAKDLAVNLENAYFEMFERWAHAKNQTH